MATGFDKAFHAPKSEEVHNGHPATIFESKEQALQLSEIEYLDAKLAQEVDVKVSKISIEDILFNKHDFNRSMDKIEVIDFHKTLEVNGIRFWCYTAGHVLGAAMLMVDIADVRVLYTRDYSREEDQHL
ncbi:hypothetical protein RYX36_030814 [Vicia faba]